MPMSAMPPRIAKLYRWRIMGEDMPVPYFVEWFKDGRPTARGFGEPDFRVMSRERWRQCWYRDQCWTCGDHLGRHRAYVIGPMCAINRTTAEPPNHLECAVWSACNCPFLSRPRMKRDGKDLPVHDEVPGHGIPRNPGVACVWVSGGELFQTETGPLIHLGDPTDVQWYAMGRKATRAEVEASIESGYPILMNLAQEVGQDDVRELIRLRAVATRYLPA